MILVSVTETEKRACPSLRETCAARLFSSLSAREKDGRREREPDPRGELSQTLYKKKKSKKNFPNMWMRVGARSSSWGGVRFAAALFLVGWDLGPDALDD